MPASVYTIINGLHSFTQNNPQMGFIWTSPIPLLQTKSVQFYCYTKRVAGMEYIRKAIYMECSLLHVKEERQIHKEMKGILGKSLKACFPIAQTLVL
jgi:hypothetical protein